MQLYGEDKRWTGRGYKIWDKKMECQEKRLDIPSFFLYTNEC